MKKSGLLLVVLMLSVNCIVAQNYQWAKSMGSTGNNNDGGTSITIDGSGNIVVAGIFLKTVDFDPGPGTANLTPFNHNADIFFAKYDGNGNYVWAINIGGLGSDYATSVNTDDSGNVLITGYFHYTVDFDPGVDTANLTAIGGTDIFFAKYDSNGNYLWAKSIEGSSASSAGYGIITDGYNNVLVTGNFYDTADFDPGVGTANLVSNGSADIFLAKYDAGGNYLWAKGIGGSNYGIGKSITTDIVGNVLLTGSFRDTVDFDPGIGTASLVANSVDDIYFAKYDANGNYQWAKSVGGSGYDGVKSVKMDGLGNVFLTGIFQDTVDFDPGVGTANLVSNGGFDIFIAKYDGNSNYLWAKGIGSPSDDFGNSLATDASGNLLITGLFSDTADFDPGVGTANLASNGNFDIFIANYDANGNYLWAKGIGGSGTDDCQSITLDGSVDIYVTGSFQLTVDFDPGPGTANLNSNGGSDIFFAKYDPFTTEVETLNPSKPFSLYPNPTKSNVRIELNNITDKLSITLINLLGQEILKSSFRNTQFVDVAMGQLKAGIYFIRINASDETTVFKVIKE